jgi:hypothetical protein
VGERRSAGQPEAGPLPGQRDISKPQVTLPPAVQELLDQLPTKDLPLPRTPGVELPRDEGSANQLLDFLLTP